MTNLESRTLMAALSLALTGVVQAADGHPTAWSFSGFGTLAAVHSTEREADYAGSSRHPNGVGRTRATGFSPDSKLGGQVTARFNPELSAVAQLVTQYQYDSSWTPQIEWANVQYQFTPALRVRLGRIATPAFMISETRFVGYANPSVRPPQEVYFLNPTTSNDGIDATHVSHFGHAVNSLSGFYGTTTARLPGGIKVDSPTGWGINNTLEMGATTVRVSHVSVKLDIDIPQIQALVDGLNRFGAAASAIPVPGIRTAGAQAFELARKYSFKAVPLQIFSIGVSHDTGRWFVTGEWVRFSGSAGLETSKAGYVSAGYRAGSWTPYATLATLKSPPSPVASIATAGLPAPLAAAATGLNAGVSAVLSNRAAATQDSLALGLRWDFTKNAAAKLQVDHIDLGTNSPGQLVNRSAAYRPGGKLNLVSVAVDFVF